MDEDYELPWDAGLELLDRSARRARTVRARRAPQDGDVVFSADGTVRRVGDAPRKKIRRASTEVVKMSSREAALERLKSALLEFGGLQALLDRFHGQEPPVGTVLRWMKKFDARSGELLVEGVGSVDDLQKALRFSVTQPTEYVFVAFRAPNGKWYTTSQRGPSTFDWDGLLKEIDDAPCQLASEWTEVPAPEKVSEEAMDPTVWAKNLFAKKDPDTSADKADVPAE